MYIQKLLIKYHKIFTKEGIFTTILVIPATNLSDTFSEFGYLGLKYILDMKTIYYAKYHPGLICEVLMEKVRLDTNRVKITSIDVVVMYPLVIFTFFKKNHISQRNYLKTNDHISINY